MSEEPKIIVDDDWKQQVQNEKEQLQQQQESGPDSSPDAQELPEASFTILVSTLSTQALASLGYIPDPVSGQPTINKPMAKHFIDTLDVLVEKTNGNLSEDESALLTGTLHQLRMAYVAPPVVDSPAGSPENSAGDSTGGATTIELP